MIGGSDRGAIFLPRGSLIERRSRAPMLDLTIFQNRLFAAAAAAAFINGLARFALTFLFVFYFQGPQGQDPITAGIELAPMAAGMLVASPIAGRIADRHGSRMLAALGMLISAVALAGMTTLGVRDAILAECDLARARRHRIGRVHEPEHRRDDGRGARRTAAASRRARAPCCRTWARCSRSRS